MGAKHASKAYWPMAQEVAEKFPDKVFAGPDGFLCVKLDDLPAGITAHDLARPVHPVEHAAAMWHWEKVFEHWRKKA